VAAVRRRRIALPLAIAAIVGAVSVAGGCGADGSAPGDEAGSIQAVFVQRSRAPGEVAQLVVRTPPRRFRVQMFHAGQERRRTRRDDVMGGKPVAPPMRVEARDTSRLSVRVPIGRWQSGLYFARLTAANHRLGYAPIVVRPRRLGSEQIAVVLPTNTWQAYNLRDDDGNGVGDSWYADSDVDSVDLTRPFLDRGVPPHFRAYDAGFLRWLARTGKHPDFVSDDDLERVSAAELSRLYDVVIFSGHEEYVTTHVFELIRRYSELGGNLAFLSANNFFYRVVRKGQRIYRTRRWRDLGESTAPFMGVEYVGWYEKRYPNRPYVVRGARDAKWFFRGTGLENGDRFGSYGIEIDHKTSRSPSGTVVLAEIPEAFGPGRSAEMTYYESPNGAKGFSAGAINFGGSAEWRYTKHLLANLWARLSRP
jgi:N,N-dimethylformamidase beta subunit-like, C-terminal